MAEVIKLADRRPRPVVSEGIAAGAAHHEATKESIQVHRASTRDEVIGWLSIVRQRIAALKDAGIGVESFEQSLEALQLQVDRFHSYCPAASGVSIIQANQSTVMLTATQFAHKNELVKDLGELVRLIDHAINKASEITAVRRQLNSVRDVVKPRQLRMENWEDADITVSWVIDAAADPHALIERADQQLRDAEVALAEHRWSEALTMINDAQSVPGLLHAASMAAAYGHLQEIG